MPTLSISRWSRTSSFSVRALLLLLFLTSAQESRLKFSCTKGMHAFCKHLLFVLEFFILLDFSLLLSRLCFLIHAHALKRVIAMPRKPLTLTLIWSKLSVDFTIFSCYIIFYKKKHNNAWCTLWEKLQPKNKECEQKNTSWSLSISI